MSQPAPPTPQGPDADALKDQASAAQLLIGCNAALRTFRIHAAENAAVERPLEGLVQNIEALVASRGRVVIAQVEGTFYLGDARLRLSGSQQGIADQLADELKRRQIGGITFQAVPAKDELIRFFKVLDQAESGEKADADKVRARLRAEGIGAIAIARPLKSVSESAEAKAPTERASDVFCAAVEHAAELYGGDGLAGPQRAPRAGNVRSQHIVQELVELAEGDPAVLLSLAGLRGSGEEEAEHLVCTAVLSIAMGKRLGLSKTALADLGLAAVYHDQGLALLPKAQRDEYDVHPVLAIKSLLGKRKLDPRLLRQVVVGFEHHLDLAGGGHPRLRFKTRLHPMSQIVRLANDFDGFTRGRHRRPPMDLHQAVRHMCTGSGTTYHPGLLRLFVELVGGVYEPGQTPLPQAEIVPPTAAAPAEAPAAARMSSLEEMAAAMAALETGGPGGSSAPDPHGAPPVAAAAPVEAGRPKKVLGALKLKRIRPSKK